MESRKIVLMNLFSGEECRPELWIEWRKERVGQIERVALKQIDYHV